MRVFVFFLLLSSVDAPVVASVIKNSGVDAAYRSLSGSGQVARSELSFRQLTKVTTESESVERVSMQAFALPMNAAEPKHQFQGRLRFSGNSRNSHIQIIKDPYNLAKVSEERGKPSRAQLPPFDFEFVHSGSYIVPVQRGLIQSGNTWEYIIEPGRVWQEKGDNGNSRVALPFALQEKNENCTHNGVMSFLFNSTGDISMLVYQISSETCLYFKADLWGQLDAVYQPAEVDGSDKVMADFQREVSQRLPAKPISQLGDDYPGIDVKKFGSAKEVPPEHMSAYGVIVDGIHYVSDCNTRAGLYPFCDVMALPSYSTAKSVFAGTALMILEKRYPGARSEPVADYVPACAKNGNWDDVRLEDLADMATGNFETAKDEGASHAQTGLFAPQDHATKIDYACNHYARKGKPGENFAYHTSDTYILGTALNGLLRQREGVSEGVFTDIIVDDLWRPLGLSPTALVSRRTYDNERQPFTGWGLTFHRDDIARLALFLGRDRGTIDGEPLLDRSLLEGTLQLDPRDRGVRATKIKTSFQESDAFRYNNGFWAYEVSQLLGCDKPTWIPFMFGYGGIIVLLLPNNMVYYYFSDSNRHAWIEAAKEANKLQSICSTT